VTGGFESRDAHLADLQLKTVFDCCVRERGFGLRSHVDAGAGSRCQLAVAGNEIGMKMSFEDVANGNVVLLCGLQVNLYITLRIDYNSLSFGRQHVGRVG
jgi:hypothetical protein